MLFSSKEVPNSGYFGNESTCLVMSLHTAVNICLTKLVSALSVATLSASINQVISSIWVSDINISVARLSLSISNISYFTIASSSFSTRQSSLTTRDSQTKQKQVSVTPNPA